MTEKKSKSKSTTVKKAGKKPPARRKMVVWSQEDKIKLADKTAELILKHPEESFSEVVRKAQNMSLPPEKHRQVTTQVTKPISEMVAKRLSEAANDRGRLRDLEIENKRLIEKIGEMIELDEAVDYLGAEDIVEKLREIPLSSILDQYPLPEVVGYAAKRLTEKVLSGRDPVSKIMDQVTSLDREVINPDPATVMKLPRVVFVGLTKAQTQHVISNLQGNIIGETLTSKEAQNRRGCSADLVVVWADFTSHGVTPHIKNHWKTPVLEARGGIGKITGLVANYFGLK